MTTARHRQLSPLRPGAGARDLGLLRSLERRVLWLSAKQVDHATGFGQSGGLADVLRHHRIDQNSIADAALGLVGRHPTRETTA